MFDLTACFTYGLCASGCPLTRVDGMDPRKLIGMCATGILKEAINSKIPWICTGCGRCAYYCLMQVNIPYCPKIRD